MISTVEKAGNLKMDTSSNLERVVGMCHFEINKGNVT